jgi:hypothetical protein
MFGMVLGGKYVCEALKGRPTYPRTFYFIFRPFPRNAKTIPAFPPLFFAGRTVGGVLGALISQTDQETCGVFIPLVMGIFWGIAPTYAVLRFGMKHFYVLSVTFIGIGLGIGAFSFGFVLGISFYYLSIGLALFALGCVALVQFLHRHKPVDLNGESP